MHMSQVTGAMALIDPLIGLALVVLGFPLMRLNRDPGLKLVVAWGAFWVLTGVWTGLVHLLIRSPGEALQWANLVSFFILVAGRLLTWATAGYALWRFWRATWARGGTG